MDHHTQTTQSPLFRHRIRICTTAILLIMGTLTMFFPTGNTARAENRIDNQLALVLSNDNTSVEAVMLDASINVVVSGLRGFLLALQ